MPIVFLLCICSAFCFGVSFVFQDGAASLICAAHGAAFGLAAFMYFVHLKIQMTIPKVIDFIPAIVCGCSLVFGVITQEPFSITIGVLGFFGALGYLVHCVFDSEPVKQVMSRLDNKPTKNKHLSFSSDSSSFGFRINIDEDKHGKV